MKPVISSTKNSPSDTYNGLPAGLDEAQEYPQAFQQGSTVPLDREVHEVLCVT